MRRLQEQVAALWLVNQIAHLPQDGILAPRLPSKSNSSRPEVAIHLKRLPSKVDADRADGAASIRVYPAPRGAAFPDQH